jgi:hypothetical protein
MYTKYIKLIFILLISTQVFAQLQITNDSISVNGKKHPFTILSYGKYSKTKPMKVFTCDKNDFQKVKENIQECFTKYKIDYTDFYIIPIDSKHCNDSTNMILKKYLNRIDEIRISQNLSTIQIQFKEYHDGKDLKIIYDETSLVILEKIENLHQNINSKNICYLVSGRK